MNLTGQTLDHKYLILEPIGVGGMSLVYRALNIHNQTPVAVKLMKENITSTYLEDFLRFKREIEVISSFHHPGIIAAYDTGEYQNRPYLVTEFLEGNSLADILQQRAGASQIDEAVEMVTQIAQALQYVHQHEVIHRDLKPGNVFVLKDAPTRIKLLDFGISYMIQLGEIKDEAEIVGTFGYMAPEASGILNRRMDERSDLYSLGVIFYHLLTGELPFKDTDLNRLLHSQAAIQPARPSEANPQISSVLEEIVLKMLEKDPDLRYQSAQGLLNDLDKYRQGERGFLVGGRDQKLKLSYQTRSVGREKELAQLKGFVEEASHGAGRICFIAGEPGIGKSRLVEEIRGYVYERNGLFLRGRCLNHENKLPYQPFKDSLDEYLRMAQRLQKEEAGREVQRLNQILGELGGIVVALNPRMEQLLGEPKPLPPLEPERENQRFIVVLAEFFSRLVPKQGSGVLFLDDLQWADEGSLGLLEELGTKIRASNLLILGTYRDQEVVASHGLERIRGRIAEQDSGFDEIKLAPFQAEPLQQLVGLLLGGAGVNGDQLLNLITERSGGNPFFAIHIVRELVESKAVFWNGTRWEIDLEKLRTMPVSGSMVALILKRINGLAEGQKELLSRAAVIGREFELELLYRLVKLDRACVVDMVDQMIAMQLLEQSPRRGQLLFAHDRIRDAFYQELTELERRQIHYEIARAIESGYSNAPELQIFELAHHYLEAGELAQGDRALEYTLVAADRAKAAYANEEALKYYQKGIEVLEREGKRGSLRWLKANGSMIDVCLIVGRNDEAISMAEQLLSLLAQKMEKARIYYKIGKAYFNKGDWVNCEANLIKGLGFMGVRIPQGKTGLICSLFKEFMVHFLPVRLRLMFSYQAGKTGVEREIFWAYVTLYYMYLLTDASKFFYNIMKMLNMSEIRLRKSRELAMSITGYAGIFMVLPIFKRALAYHRRALEVFHTLGDEWGSGYAKHNIGRTLSWMGLNSEGISYYEAAMNKHQMAGDMWEMGMEAQGLGMARFYNAEYQKARIAFEQYMAISRKIRDEFGLVSACLGLGFVCVETGAWQKAREYLEQAITICENRGIWFTHCCAISCLGYLELQLGNYEEAIGQLEKAKKRYEANHFVKDSTLQLYPLLADAYLKQYQARFLPGRRMTLHERLKMGALCKDALRRTKRWPNHYGAALRVTADFYTLTGKYGLAQRYFIKSISFSEKYGRRHELAKCYFEYGLWWEKRHQETEAHSFRLKAGELFSEIGAAGYLANSKEFRASNLKNSELARPRASEQVNARDRLRVERRLRTVLATGRYLSSILDLDELLPKIIDHAMELVGAERGLLMLYPEAGERTLEPIVNRKVGREEFRGKEFGGSRSIIARVEQEQKPLLIMDALADEDFKTQSSVVLMGIRSALAVPVLAKGAFLGVIYLDNRLLSGLFTEEDLQVLDLIANQAGISIENARYLNEIQKSREEISAWNQTLEQRVIERTQQLEEVNRELQAYASVAEELAVAKERNRIARDVHDTLGQTLSVLVTMLEASQDICEINPEETRQVLMEAVKITRGGLNEVRRSVAGLVWDEERVINYIASLEEMIAHFQLSGMKVNLEVDESLPNLSRNYMDTIYRVCQEALTNSLKHGRATEAHIFLRFDRKLIKLYIFDNGCGCMDCGKSSGFGLRGMRQRVESLRGKIIFGSDGETGFNIQVEIPVEGESK